MTSDQIGIFSNVSIIGEWKQEIDLFSNLSEIISNIVVTLSAFRSNAEPWRLFLCTSDQRSVPIECDERRNSSLIRYAGSADGGLGKSICRLAADPKVDILKYIQKCA